MKNLTPYLLFSMLILSLIVGSVSAANNTQISQIDSAHFNGVNSYINLPINTYNYTISPPPSKGFTITAWVFPTRFNQPSNGFGKGATIIDANENGSLSGYVFGICNPLGPFCSSNNGEGLLWWWPQGGGNLNSTASIPLDTWTQVAITYVPYNNSNLNYGGILSFYINGNLNSIQSSMMPYPPSFLKIGAKSWIAGDFNGSIANVQMYDAPLNSNEISVLYLNGISANPLSSLPTLSAIISGWWPLNGTANDYSGNHKNGIAYNISFGTGVSGSGTGPIKSRTVTYPVTINEVPSAAASTWQTCIQYTAPNGTVSNNICTDSTGTVVANVPSGSEITYICASNIQSGKSLTSTSYAWSGWWNSSVFVPMYTGNNCPAHGNYYTVMGSTSLDANFLTHIVNGCGINVVSMGQQDICGPFTVVLDNITYTTSSNKSFDNVLSIYKNGLLTNITSITMRSPTTINVGGSNLSLLITSSSSPSSYPMWSYLDLNVSSSSTTPVTPFKMTLEVLSNTINATSGFLGGSVGIINNSHQSSCGSFNYTPANSNPFLTIDCQSNEGTKLVLSASPNYNYSFLGWVGTGSGSYTGPNQTILITMNSYITEQAYFRSIVNHPVTRGSNSPLISHQITLNPGWNLISFSVANVDRVNIDSCINYISGNLYDMANGKYVAYNGSSLLAEGAGYWIDVNATCTIPYSGTILNASDYQPLTSGWNLISGPSVATSFSRMEGNCNVSGGPYGYNTVSGNYYNTSILYPNKGYFVYVKTDCTLGTSQSSPPPPPS